MAEGGEDEQSPRKTTTYNRFEGMNSQKSRYGVPDNEMFWLENIMRVAPKKLHSVPGPTGNLATFPIITPGCPETTVPTGTQSLEVIHCYEYNTGLPPGTLPNNSAGQMNFVGGNPLTTGEHFLATVSTQTGSGDTLIPPNNYQILLATGETITGATSPAYIGLPAGYTSATFIGESAQAGASGKSDERSYLFNVHDLNPHTPIDGSDVLIYFSYDQNASWIMDHEIIIGFLHGAAIGGATWAKHNNEFFTVGADVFAHRFLGRYVFPAGGGYVGQPVNFVDVTGIIDAHEDNLETIQATDNFLWILYRPIVPVPDPSHTVIYKFDKTSLTLLQTFAMPTSYTQLVNMFAVSDDLFYLYSASSPPTFSYYQPSTGMVTDIGTVDFISCTGGPSQISGQGNMIFNKGYFYLTYGGFGTGFTNTVKIGTLVCPGTNIPIGT